MVRSSSGDCGPVSPIIMISPMIEDTGARTGDGVPVGSIDSTAWSFSDTSCRARKMSVSHSNSTQTTEMPRAVDDRTRRTPVAPFTAVSMGNVTKASTSSGAMPGASVRMVTVGAVRSGKTSTGSLGAVQAPAARMTTAVASTRSRFCSDHAMSRFNIAAPQCSWP